MKLLRVLRLDTSDTFIFPRVAELSEWAISGAFVFADADLPALQGKELAAFRSGFLGVPSLGWSTLAQVVDATADDRNAAIEALTQCLLERFGAPDRTVARKAAEEEIDFVTSLSDHPSDTLVALHRREENGTIREVFRSLKPQQVAKRWRAFSFVDAEAEDEPGDAVDLLRLARGAGE
jgi:hypothetical protein